MRSKVMVCLASVVLSAVALNACSVKLKGSGSGGDPSPSPKLKGFFGDETPSVSGPDIAGDWASKCNSNWKSEGTYRKFLIKYTADRAERTTATYQDSKCEKQIELKTYSGPYRFIAQLSDDIYTVQYAFELGSGVHQLTQENVKLKDDKLYIADYASGEGMGVLIEEPLSRISGGNNEVQPPPEEPSQPVSAQIAESYSEARYAVCNSQGRVWVIDLNGVLLTQANAGNVKIVAQRCADQKPEFGNDTYKVTVTMKDSRPQLVSEETGYGNDHIETWDTGTGLLRSGYPSSAYGVLGGNSGPCFFLKNVGKIDEMYKICQ